MYQSEGDPCVGRPARREPCAAPRRRRDVSNHVRRPFGDAAASFTRFASHRRASSWSHLDRAPASARRLRLLPAEQFARGTVAHGGGGFVGRPTPRGGGTVAFGAIALKKKTRTVRRESWNETKFTLFFGVRRRRRRRRRRAMMSVTRCTSESRSSRRTRPPRPPRSPCATPPRGASRASPARSPRRAALLGASPASSRAPRSARRTSNSSRGVVPRPERWTRRSWPNNARWGHRTLARRRPPMIFCRRHPALLSAVYPLAPPISGRAAPAPPRAMPVACAALKREEEKRREEKGLYHEALGRAARRR